MIPQSQAIRFLVLDDDAIMRKLISRSLNTLGHHDILTCGRGIDALQQLNRDPAPAEVILCDLNMPEMDGIEFLRNLAALGYGGGIILISGEDRRILRTAEKLTKAHRLSILGYLEKPVRIEQLRAILARWPMEAPSVEVRTEPDCTAEDIERGLAAGEFVAYFQPKVEPVTGWVSGVEALVRWRHPVHGMISPERFIGIAEQHGLIGQLTTRMLSESLRQAQAWRNAGLTLKVAVNVSMDDLVQLDFPDQVAAAAAAAGIPPFDLTLEVTESRLMRDPAAPLDILTRLRLKRIALSIDDFGTGYSNLAQLNGIPFDELKIDRSFVHGAANDPGARAILEASVDLGKKLNMRVVAEGVETRADWDRVSALGCDLAQGYFIARPMPGDALPGWLKNWRSP
ncbi:EAL domain-containing protein [Herbaspirillum sp. HC18]|nr:EAL domain-containing protein [Herbaspirillum sp. HC18]